MIAPCRTVLAGAGLLLGTVSAVRANPDPAEEIRILSERLRDQPEAGTLLQRAALYRSTGNWSGAEADCAAAARLEPRSLAVAMEQSRLNLARGQGPAALARLDELLRQFPDHAAAFEVRAAVRESLQDKAGARSDLDEAIRLARPPVPDWFLRRAALTADPGQALEGIEAGLRALGPLPALVFKALALEQAAGQYDRALRRVESLLASSPGHLPWWKAKIGVLAAMGDTAAAAAARRKALEILDALPPRRRNTAAMQELRRELTAGAPADLPPFDPSR